MDRNEEGFTLIELMVVVAILAVLVAIGTSSFLGFERTAQRAGAADELRSVALSARSLRVAQGSYADLAVYLTSLDPNVTLDPTGEDGTAVLVGPSGDACLTRVTPNQEILGIWLSHTELPTPQMWGDLGALPASCPDYAGAVSAGYTTSPF